MKLKALQVGLALREVQNSQVEQRRESRWFGRKIMSTGIGHGRVAAEGDYVLVVLVLREFSLEIVKLLPTTSQFLFSIGSTV